RLQAFEAAGADLLYLPVPPGKAELAQVLASVTKPVNALAAGPLKALTVAELAAMGVRRISTGSQIARATHAAIRDAVGPMLGQGSFAGIAAPASGDEIDALLQRGAAHVTAVDVGKGLLHQKIRSDQRVQVLEGNDFKNLRAADLAFAPEAFVADVSFTSLEAVLENAFVLLQPKLRPAEGMVLFKPQFELPKAERELLVDGILEDREKSHQLLADFKARIAKLGVTAVREMAATVKGAKGNQEFVLHLVRQ
ncbi:MAG: isocitrate lyase/phosphoenolpyruvate mutase family protein, partial [Spirochaetes bacterium]|nr:isocitrate lyase/phosphoenolpyruvate mutase family protein [Spirochaetota bacterium]